MKRSKPIWTAALLALMFAAPLFAASNDVELLKAARNGDTAAVRALISADADVNARKDSGITALSLAIEKGHTETANVLRNAGAR